MRSFVGSVDVSSTSRRWEQAQTRVAFSRPAIFGSQSVWLAAKLVLGFSIAFPLLWMVITSLKARPEAVSWPPSLLPATWQWANYVRVWNAGSFDRWLINSMIVAVAVSIGNVAIGAPAAYAFARLRFPGKDIAFSAVLATLMIPGELTLIPTFVLLAQLGWIDTYLALIVPFLVNGYSIFLLRQFFESIPQAIADSATIDGAGAWTTLWSIFLPMARPALAVAVFFSFLGSWNAYLFPLITTRSEHMRTMTVGLSLFRQEFGTDWPLLMGAATLIALPAVLGFLLVERHLTDALTLTGMKG
jgi:multiple sugar transport system permease protein